MSRSQAERRGRQAERIAAWLDQGVIRRIFCNVDAPAGG